MGLAEQVIAQSQMGSAQGQGFGDFFAKGMQMGQEQQRINLAERQLAAELAMQPLKQTLLQQQSALNAYHLEDTLRQRQIRVESEGALSRLADRIGKAQTEATPQDAIPFFFEEIRVNPRIAEDPRFQQLWKDANTSLAAHMTLQQLKNEGRNNSYQPGFGTDVNPLTGKPEAFFRTSPNSAQLVKDTQDTPQSTLGKLMADRAKAEAAGDMDAVRNYDAEIELRKTKSGFQVTTNPDGSVQVTQGPLTTGNKAKVQQTLSDNLQTIDTANRLEPLISNETVGVAAFAKSWINDRILAQRYPSLASSNRANAETLATQLQSSAVRALRSDGNISEAEREQILESIPDINDPVDSPARAKQLIQSVRRLSAIHAVVAASKLGQPVPKQAAQALGWQELKRLVKEGLLSKEQAVAAFDAL